MSVARGCLLKQSYVRTDVRKTLVQTIPIMQRHRTLPKLRLQSVVGW